MSDIICWYSSGAASAVATKLMLNAGHSVRIIKTETNSEHPDNARFDREVSAWLGQEIEYRHNGKYHDVDDVIAKTRYMSGPYGARCTVELKKMVRYALEKETDYEALHVFGYTANKKDAARFDRLIANSPELKAKAPLVEAGYTKSKCFQVLTKAGISLPVMYLLGFPNNNCIGCLKADSYQYWFLVQRHFPEVFRLRAKQERDIGHAICRIGPLKTPVYLDELEQYLANRQKSPGQLAIPSFSCDFLCTG